MEQEKEEHKGLVEYESMTGEKLQLSKSIIKQYLVSGDASKVSDQEVMMFLSLCKFQRLNPFLREAYLIKYGNGPATIVVGKETFLKRAVKNPRYQGHKTWTEGEGEDLVGFAEVYVEGYKVPIRCEADFKEYAGKKADGTINKMWTEKPKTMIKKVPLVQALREAFPEDFGGQYAPEELESSSLMGAVEVEEETVKRKSESGAKSITEKKDKEGKPDDGKDPKATAQQVKMIYAKLKSAGIDEAAFKGYFGLESMKDLLKRQVSDALEAIEKGKVPADTADAATKEFGEEKEF